MRLGHRRCFGSQLSSATLERQQGQSRSAMRYWWVNQNQTYKQERDGGYLWSPKRKSNGAKNAFYEFMREVAPGDIVFSFADTLIPAIGVAQSTAYEAPKPPEFGSAGPNWSAIGWKVAIRYFPLRRQIRPADDMQVLRPFLPPKYSPLQANGRGNQGVYLTHVPGVLAEALIQLIGEHAKEIVSANFTRDFDDLDTPEAIPDIESWEDHLSEQIQLNQTLNDTERSALVQARRGQGVFKKNVRLIERRCRVTGVDRIEHLIASHSKPWRDCETAEERLDGENGLLLTPSIDHLFDRGFISFEANGRLLLSPVADKDALRRMGVPVDGSANVGNFSQGQKRYLEFHQEAVFLEAKL